MVWIDPGLLKLTREQTEPLSSGELEILVKQLRQNPDDEEARYRLIYSHVRLAAGSAIKMARNQPNQSDDLFAAALLGLVTGVASFIKRPDVVDVTLFLGSVIRRHVMAVAFDSMVGSSRTHRRNKGKRVSYEEVTDDTVSPFTELSKNDPTTIRDVFEFVCYNELDHGILEGRLSGLSINEISILYKTPWSTVQERSSELEDRIKRTWNR